VEDEQDMRRIFLSIILLLFLAPQVFGGEEQIIPEHFNRFEPTYAKVDDNGTIWTGYQDTNGEFHVRNLTSKADTIVSAGKGKASRGYILETQGNRLYLAWREKIESRKGLYFRAISDGGKTVSDPVLLDDNKTEALSRIRIGSNAKGDVFVLWYGEKMVNKERYHYYIAVSNDFGKTFSEPRNVTPGYDMAIYPTLLVEQDNAYIFSYAVKGGKHYMIFSQSQDHGKTWTEPVEIKETPGTVTTYIKPLKTAKRLHVFWYCTTEDGPVIQGAYSDDDGKTWKARTFEDTKGISTNYLDVAADAKDHIYLVFSGNRENSKSNVHLMTSNDNGSTWAAAVSPRHYPFDKTMALFPKVIVTEDGKVVVVWIDYRNIRSNIYLQYSDDFGKTWLEKDRPLEEPGKFNTYYNATVSENFVKVRDRYHLLAFRFPGDMTNSGEADLFLLDFGLNQRGEK
jgi:hypothetical protein